MRIVSWIVVVTLLAVSLLAAHDEVSAQALGPSRTGPAIEGFGPVYAVPDPDLATPTGVMRGVWDVALGTDAPEQLNPRIESLARFLNMHAQAGVPRESLKLAMVVHGTAGKDLLGHEGYRARLGVDNPNYEMIQALIGFGVEVVLCGQTQMARGLPRDQLAEGVKVALSAMTALIDFQDRGYRLIPF